MSDFPISRYVAAGASPDEVDTLTAAFDHLTPDEQASTLAHLASIASADLYDQLAAMRAEASEAPSDATESDAGDPPVPTPPATPPAPSAPSSVPVPGAAMAPAATGAPLAGAPGPTLPEPPAST